MIKLEVQQMWEQRIERAQKVKSNWRVLFRVETVLEYLDGQQRDQGYLEGDWITINNMYSHMKAMLPSLYSMDPYFYIKLARSYRPDPMLIALWELRGEVRSAMVNYLKRELKLKEKVRVSITDALSAFGVAKVRYRADSVDNPTAGVVIRGETSGEPLKDEDGNYLTEPDKIPANARYVIDRVNPEDILFDEDAGPLEESWSWIAQRIMMRWDELESDSRFNKKVVKAMKTKGSVKTGSEADQEQRDRERRKKGDIFGPAEGGRNNKASTSDRDKPPVEVWEVYDLIERKWLLFTKGADALLMDASDVPPGVCKHPFSILRFTLRGDSPYPHPPLSPLLDPAQEYNRARSDIQKHRKRFNRKYAGSKQAFGDDTAEITKLEVGDDGTIVMVNGDPRGAVAAIQDAQIDPMRYNELSYLKMEMVELAGHNSSEAPGLATAGSATQSAILDKRLEIKEGDSLSQVIDFVLDIARKLDMLVQTHIEKDEAVKISGPRGEYWQLVRASDYEEIEGEYEYNVNIGATQPRLPHIERASWQAFLALLATFPQLALSKHLLTKMAEMHHIEDERMVDEVYEIASKMMSGQLPMPGQQGSQPGVPEERPVSATGGAAGGVQSLSKGNAAIGG
jgi:hypothetical protein